MEVVCFRDIDVALEFVTVHQKIDWVRESRALARFAPPSSFRPQGPWDSSLHPSSDGSVVTFGILVVLYWYDGDVLDGDLEVERNSVIDFNASCIETEGVVPGFV